MRPGNTSTSIADASLPSQDRGRGPQGREGSLTRGQSRLVSLESQLHILKSQLAYSRISLTFERIRTPGPLGFAGKTIALDPGGIAVRSAGF